jgi:hypothetical protein
MGSAAKRLAKSWKQVEILARIKFASSPARFFTPRPSDATSGRRCRCLPPPLPSAPRINHSALVAGVFSRPRANCTSTTFISLLSPPSFLRAGGIEVHHPLLHCYLHRATPVHTHTTLPAVVTRRVERARPWSCTTSLVCCVNSRLCCRCPSCW